MRALVVVMLLLLLPAGCAARLQRCARHLQPINVAAPMASNHSQLGLPP